MFAMNLSWKSFNVDLEAVDAWIKTNAGNNYTGNSADNSLRLWYSEEPTQEIKDAIQTYWDAITEESTEATGYVSSDTIKTTIETLRAGIPDKTWNQLTTAERKLVLGQTPTRAQLGL